MKPADIDALPDFTEIDFDIDLIPDLRSCLASAIQRRRKRKTWFV